MTEFVKERLIENGIVTAPFKTVPKQNKPQTLESLYDIPKDKTQNDRKVVWKANTDVIQRLITLYNIAPKIAIYICVWIYIYPHTTEYYFKYFISLNLVNLSR